VAPFSFFCGSFYWVFGHVVLKPEVLVLVLVLVACSEVLVLVLTAH
jgi:hypothetical protein